VVYQQGLMSSYYETDHVVLKRGFSGPQTRIGPFGTWIRSLAG